MMEMGKILNGEELFEERRREKHIVKVGVGVGE